MTIDADKILVVNGQKVFPITLSPGPPTNGKTPTGADALDELRSAGAMCIRMAQTTDWNSTVISNQQAQLDWAAQHGMYCMVNLRELSHFAAGNTAKEASLRNVVNLFKNHPALAFWKNKDEAWWGNVSADELQRGYEVIKQEDPFHPVEQTHAPRGTVADLRPYNAAADILALDIYPVGYPPGANSLLTNKEISMIGDYTDFLAEVANGEKQFWMVEQIAWSGVVPPGKTLRFPTYAQSRYMAYQAIIRGARGLMFFGGNVAATLNPRDAALGWNWTFWDEVLKPVVRQLSATNVLGEALVAPNSTRPIQMNGASDIEFCVREVPPYLYILAAKREGATVNVTFSGLPESASVGEVLYESPRLVKATNGVFSDWFGPFEVHVYRFNIPNEAPSIIAQPQSRTNYVGTTATFNVTATGSPPLTYRWRKDGADLFDGINISGATSNVLEILNVAAEDSGIYDVVVNGYGSVTSAPAVLSVTAVPTSPTITTQPQSRINYIGSTATFSVAATGTEPFTYRWRKNGVNLSDGGNVSGATASVLVLTNVSQADVAGYEVIVTGYGSVTSAPPATLTLMTNSLILYEPFDYSTVGLPVSSNTPANWALNGSGANDLSVVSGSLSYPGLINSVGNSVTNGGAGPGVRRLLGSAVNSGVLYFSALFRINDLGAGTWNGNASQVGALTAPDNVSFRLAVMARLTGATNYILGVQKGGSGVTAVYEGVDRAAGETVFLVGKYEFAATPNRVTLWVNPGPASFGASSEPGTNSLTANTGTDGYPIDRFNMRQNTAASVPASMQWDELRFGTTWAEVTPAGPAQPNQVLLTNVIQLNDGTFQFEYRDSSSQTFEVYASTNLAQWQPIGAATRIAPGLFQFNDNGATNFPKRFYQLRSP